MSSLTTVKKKQASMHVEAVHWSIPGIPRPKKQYTFCLISFLKRNTFVRPDIVLCAKKSQREPLRRRWCSGIISITGNRIAILRYI